MLSFNSGKQVAIVCGGAHDDQIIYITDEKDEPEREVEDEADVFDILDDDDFKQSNYKNYSMKEKFLIAQSLIDANEDENKKNQKYLKDLHEDDKQLFLKLADMQDKLTFRLKKEFELSSGIMIPLPDENSERIYIAGKSGSGKSFLTAVYAREYHDLFPKRKIYIFTKHEKERAYKNIPHVEITCDDDMVKDEIDVKQFKKSLVIFDDCDHIQDKKISVNIKRFNNDLITTGRKYDIHTITLQHQLMDYKETRNLLNEANKVIFFNSASNYHVTRYLKVYVGLDPQQIKKITSLKSRWTMISLSIPTYVLHEHGIFML